MGQDTYSTNCTTSNLSRLQSAICGHSLMYAAILWPFVSDVCRCLEGQNRDYQKIALNYAVNVMKLAYILSMFPKALKP
jgi:hypothetical protein